MRHQARLHRATRARWCPGPWLVVLAKRDVLGHSKDNGQIVKAMVKRRITDKWAGARRQMDKFEFT